MLKAWSLVLCVMASLPYSLLEELAIKSKSLYPVMEVVDLYHRANMLDKIPLHCPIKIKDVFRLDMVVGRTHLQENINFIQE